MFNSRIRRVDRAGIITTVAGIGTDYATGTGYSGDGGPALSARLFWPQGVSVDLAGNVLIADTQNARIRKVDASGTINTVAGNPGGDGIYYAGDGGPATMARLNAPHGVAADRNGNILIADTGNARVRRVDAMGTINTVAGPFFYPTVNDVVADAVGNVFISYHTMIRKLSPDGTVSTIAGSDTGGYSGDGGQAASATRALRWGLPSTTGETC